MSNERLNPFADASDLDDFSPKAAEPKRKPVDTAGIDLIAETQGFPSRQPKKEPEHATPAPQRRYRTGRNQQLNIKATAETVAQFNQMVTSLGITSGELLERALAALQKR